MSTSQGVPPASRLHTRIVVGLAVLVACSATPALAQSPLRTIAGLTEIAIYESTSTRTRTAFAAASAELANRHTVLNNSSRDFSYAAGENYDVFYSDANGTPNLSGAFLTIENAGADDRLVSASAEVSKVVELHSMSMEGDVMRMRQLDSIALPAGKAVALKPGALHIMLIGLKAPLKEGDKFPLKLKFEKAGEVTVQVNVEAAGASHEKH